jgi:hypothetical protein
MSLGARLTPLRLAKGESLQQVADAVGVSKAHIWELAKGRTDNPSMALVTRAPLSDCIMSSGSARSSGASSEACRNRRPICASASAAAGFSPTSDCKWLPAR